MVTLTNLPDAPWIRDAELNGIDAPDPVKCPVCGEECDTIYVNKDSHDALGCRKCIHFMDAYDWKDLYGGDG